MQGTVKPMNQRMLYIARTYHTGMTVQFELCHTCHNSSAGGIFRFKFGMMQMSSEFLLERMLNTSARDIGFPF